MRDDTPSRTAAWVAAARHLGRLLPEDVRLADDPYGALFTSAALAGVVEEAVSEAPAGSRLAVALRRVRHPFAMLPGIREWILYMQVRTRVIDDALRAFVASGGRQVLVLGAGYDTRALRLPELAASRVIEVDHPATQSHKRAVLERHGIASPAELVAWDFEARPMEDLAEELVAVAGHDPTAPTLTIWEGVTMYLSEPAIEASLRAIVEWSAPRSELAMTYFARQELAAPSLATRAIRAVVGAIGEPWRWGWVPEELPGYLAERGLELAQDLAMSDAARELLPAELAALVANANSKRVAVAGASAESIARVCRP